jgi:hypothetical protein
MEDSFNWIKPIISSCTNQFHIDTCIKILELFALKYNEEKLFATAYNELATDLSIKTISINLDV